MDRSFLTNAWIVEASRNFVCIRLATYEDAEEAEFLKEIFAGRTGELENTVFCLLGPDGRERLSRAHRGTNQVFRTPRQMAAEMDKIAEQYPARETDEAPALPQMKDFRLGLNVAACDGLPVVAVVAEDQEQLKELQTRLSPLALSPELAGRFAYASIHDHDQLKPISGDKPEAGYLIIAPDEYGIAGTAQQVIAADASAEEIASVLGDFADEFEPPAKDHHQHVRSGKEAGIDWQTEIPVTDPMANRARQRGGPGKGKGGPPPRRRKR
ncbi:MAG: thioredoxin family protein [Pirellulaceae bacterium]